MKAGRTSALQARRPARARGVSLIEIMVGLVIGMIATAIIFQTFSVAESFKRNTTSAGDAQQNGLFSTFTLALELANAGNGLATAAQMLDSCPRVNDVATTWRPLPVVIQPGADVDTPDAFVVTYSVSPALVYPAPLVAKTAKGGSKFLVQSPNGFDVGDLFLAISTAGTCETFRVQAVNPPRTSLPNAGGTRELTTTAPAANDYQACAPPTPCGILPLGRADRAQRVRFDVANGVLRSTDLLTPNAPVVPLASNVVNMKVQYGVDDVGDGLLHAWVDGTKAPWRETDMLNATVANVNRIKAVRIGIVVRSAQYERELATWYPPSGDFNWVLFDCEAHDNTCAGRLTGTIGADANGGGYRYRVYETVVPLRNHLWNRL